MAFRFVKKLLTAAAVLTIISSLTNTSASFSFAGKQPQEIKNEVSQTFEESTNEFAKKIGKIIDATNFKKKEDVENMSDIVVELANDYAEQENLGEFKKASMIRVVDGDTIVVDIEGDDCGRKEHECSVRLIGVNTPESVASDEYLEKKGTTNSEEGKVASEYTKSLLSNYDYVYLQSDTSDEDPYGRKLRYVWLEVPTDKYDLDEISTEMLNAVLLEQGYAELAVYHPDDAYEEFFSQLVEDYDDYDTY